MTGGTFARRAATTAEVVSEQKRITIGATSHAESVRNSVRHEVAPATVQSTGGSQAPNVVVLVHSCLSAAFTPHFGSRTPR